MILDLREHELLEEDNALREQDRSDRADVEHPLSDDIETIIGGLGIEPEEEAVRCILRYVILEMN